MQDISNTSGTNFSLPTSTQQKPVVVPVPVEVPVAVPVPVAVAHSGVHHEPAPTVSAPTLDSFSPQIDVNDITNSGTPVAQRASAPAATGQPPVKDQVSQFATNASNLAAQKVDEFTAGRPTSDPSVSPVGPPSHDQNKAEEHVDGLSRGIAGVVLTTPLVAVEKISQTRIAQQVASHLPGHATGGPTLTEQAQPYVQSAVGGATSLATQAREQGVPAAQNLAGQAAGYASSALNAIYGAAQSTAHSYQPDPTDTLDELTERLNKEGTEAHSTAVTDKHTTAVTAVETSPVLPIDGAALLPSQGKTDRDIDGVEAKYAGGSATPQPSMIIQNTNAGVVGGRNTHDAEPGATSTGPHEAIAAAPVPDEASSVLKNADHAKNATQRREERGAIYADNIHADQDPAKPIAPVEHYTAVYPQGGAQSTPGQGKPIESVIPLEPIASGNKSSSAAGGVQGVDYNDARQKADVATDKGASAASSALDSAAGQAGVNKDHVPSADQIKKTADDKVTEKVTRAKPGETREPIDTAPPTDHDNAVPQFLEGEPKADLKSKIKSLFHSDKANSDF